MLGIKCCFGRSVNPDQEKSVRRKGGCWAFLRASRTTASPRVPAADPSRLAQNPIGPAPLQNLHARQPGSGDRQGADSQEIQPVSTDPGLLEPPMENRLQSTGINEFGARVAQVRKDLFVRQGFRGLDEELGKMATKIHSKLSAEGIELSDQDVTCLALVALRVRQHKGLNNEDAINTIIQCHQNESLDLDDMEFFFNEWLVVGVDVNKLLDDVRLIARDVAAYTDKGKNVDGLTFEIMREYLRFTEPSDAIDWFNLGVDARDACALTKMKIDTEELKSIIEKAKRAQSGIANLSGHEVLEFLKFGVDRADIPGYLAKITGAQYQPWLEQGFSRPQALLYQDAGLSPAQMLPFKDEFVKPEEFEILQQADPEDRILFFNEFRRCKIPLSKNVLFGHMTDQHLEGSMQNLGSGAFNTVFQGTYRLPGDELFSGVYKEELVEHADRYPTAACHSGIDMKNPQYGRRNIAAWHLNSLLGYSVVPRTEFGIHDGKLGVVMAHAKGISPKKVIVVDESEEHRQGYQQIKNDPWYAVHYAQFIGAKKVCAKEGGKLEVTREVSTKLVYTDPVLRRELVKLQLMDHLCAQVDRHGGNYFVQLDQEGKAVSVTGIDNDFAFGKKIKDPNGINFKGAFGVWMPGVVDQDMYDTFTNLTPEDLDRVLSGLLNDDEIAATKQRLAGIQSHLQALNEKGRVIQRDQWDSSRVSDFLSLKHNSYVARDKADLQARMVINPQNVKSYEKLIKTSK